MGRAGKGFAAVAHTALLVFDAGGGVGKIQLAAVAAHLARGGECQMQVAQHLVAAEGGILGAAPRGSRALAGEVGVDQLFGLGVPTRQQQAPDLGQVLGGIGPVGILRRSGPDGALIQQHPFFGDTAEEHGPEAAVAQR